MWKERRAMFGDWTQFWLKIQELRFNRKLIGLLITTLGTGMAIGGTIVAWLLGALS
jgi:hypothetical protein